MATEPYLRAPSCMAVRCLNGFPDWTARWHLWWGDERFEWLPNSTDAPHAVRGVMLTRLLDMQCWNETLRPVNQELHEEGLQTEPFAGGVSAAATGSGTRRTNGSGRPPPPPPPPPPHPPPPPTPVAVGGCGRPKIIKDRASKRNSVRMAYLGHRDVSGGPGDPTVSLRLPCFPNMPQVRSHQRPCMDAMVTGVRRIRRRCLHCACQLDGADEREDGLRMGVAAIL